MPRNESHVADDCQNGMLTKIFASARACVQFFITWSMRSSSYFNGWQHFSSGHVSQCCAFNAVVEQ